MANPTPMEIDLELCDGCGDCVPVCEPAALQVVYGKAVLIRPERCQSDGACEPICPRNAIRVPFIVVFAESATG